MKAHTTCWTLVLLFILAGCDLVEQPKDFVSAPNFYQTAADANASVIGVYDAYQSGAGTEDFIHLTNMSGCIGYTLDSRYTYLMTGNPTADGTFLRRAWDGLYAAVRKANTTIEHVPGVDMEPVLRDRYVAEARFLRALAYSYIVRLWGPVPLRVPENATTETHLAPSPINEVYDLIIEDLQFAEENLGVKGDYEPGRATKSAARALLAKIHLTLASSADCAATGNPGCEPYSIYTGTQTEHYQKAKELSAQIINQSGYRLLPDFNDLWGAKNKNNDESIFKILALANTSDVSWALSALYTPLYSEWSPWPSWFGGLTYEFVKSYDTTDVRYTDNLIWEHEDIRENVDTTWKWIRDLDDPTKLNDESSFRFWVMTNKKYGDEEAQDWRAGPAFPVFRMSEVYLIYAEAENELNGPTNDAVAKLNAVRERAGVAPLTAGSKEDLRSKILDERGWELALEAKDWFDFVRTGTLEDRCYNLSLDLRGQDAQPHPRARDSKSYIFPYPQDEVETNLNLQQR